MTSDFCLYTGHFMSFMLLGNWIFFSSFKALDLVLIGGLVTCGSVWSFWSLFLSYVESRVAFNLENNLTPSKGSTEFLHNQWWPSTLAGWNLICLPVLCEICSSLDLRYLTLPGLLRVYLVNVHLVFRKDSRGPLCITFLITPSSPRLCLATSNHLNPELWSLSH